MSLKVVNVVAAVMIKDNKVFTTERGYGEFKGGFEFPGGKIEPGETPEEALVREIKEELDATVEVHELIDVIDYDYPTFHLHMNCYRCDVVDGHVKLLEHLSAKWLDKDSLYSVNWLPADISTVKKLESILK